MKILIISIVAVLATATAANTTDTKVYICNSKGGKHYHWKKDCRGLSRCKAEIKEVTEKEATDSGKTLCGYEK